MTPTATTAERLPIVRLLDGAREAVLEIPLEAADELVTADALLGLARERGLAVDHAVDAAIRALAARHAARKARSEGGDPADDRDAPTTATVARAEPPIPGTDARIDWADAFRPAADGSDRPAGADADADSDSGSDGATARGETGAVDHYNRIKRTKVAAGVVLGVLVPPGEGVDGRDVCGQTMPARRGRKLALRPHESVQVEADGTIRALKDGVLSLARLEIAVVDTLEVAGAVDFSTGNVDFVGSVTVGDGVRDNFTLKATGDVVVRGLVEAADLLAGGDCRCERGFAARGTGHLLVDGSLEAAYLNGVRGRVRGSASIDREIVGTDLVVGEDLRVARGSIVGGTIVVGGAVVAASIGTEAGAKTTVRVGGRPLELAQAARLAALAKEIARQVAPMKARRDEIAEKGDRATAAEKESITELEFEVAELERRVRLLDERRMAVLRAVGERRTVRVEVAKAIHAGVTLAVGAREARFTKSVKGPVLVTWDEDRNLRYRVGSGPEQDLREVATIREVA
ncbi:MAG: hypothetical protein RI967_1820 [Planctomycetota bacterium]